jgi:hypothetical protein
MPFKSAKQKRFMQAVAHSKSFAKKVGVKMSAAKKMLSHAKRKKK